MHPIRLSGNGQLVSDEVSKLKKKYNPLAVGPVIQVTGNSAVKVRAGSRGISRRTSLVLESHVLMLKCGGDLQGEAALLGMPGPADAVQRGL